MKKQINLFVELQKVITRTGILISKLDKIPESLQTLDSEVKEFENSIKEYEQLLNEYNKKYRSSESETKLLLSKISNTEQKSNLAKTNKEYKSFLKEIDSLKEKNSQIENQILALLDQIDQTQALYSEKEEQGANFYKQAEKEKEQIKKQEQVYKKELADLKEKQKTISAEIKPDLLTIFMERKKSIKNNVAIAPVEDCVCRGCNMNIPPQLYNNIRAENELLHCPHCHRFLYYETV